MTIKKNTLWNLFGSVTPMLIGVVAVPYIYQKIGTERIGVLTLIWALIGYFSIFDFGIGRAITQRIASHATDEMAEKKLTTATTGVFLTFAIGLAGAAIGFIVLSKYGLTWINSSSEIEPEIYTAFLLACIAVPATTTTAGIRGVLEGEQNFKTINILKLILGISNFASPVASIYLNGPRLDHIVGWLVITRYIILIAHFLCATHIIKNIKTNLTSAESVLLLRFGSWMTLSNIISPLMVVADRFFIASFLGASVVAYYTIPAEFMIKLLIIPAAITSTLFPAFAKSITAKENDSITLYYKGMKYIFLVMGLVSIITILGSKFGLQIWLGPDFSEKSSSIASILVIGILFNSMAQLPHAYIQASGNSKTTAIIHIFESILYIPTLMLMMRLYGITGAAITWMLRALLDLTLLHTLAMRKKI